MGLLCTGCQHICFKNFYWAFYDEKKFTFPFFSAPPAICGVSGRFDLRFFGNFPPTATSGWALTPSPRGGRIVGKNRGKGLNDMTGSGGGNEPEESNGTGDALPPAELGGGDHPKILRGTSTQSRNPRGRGSLSRRDREIVVVIERRSFWSRAPEEILFHLTTYFIVFLCGLVWASIQAPEARQMTPQRPSR